MFGFGMDLLGPRMPFNREYHCFSVSMMPGHERSDVENGGKIILPPSALEHLTRLNTAYPMLFKLTNSRKNRTTHSGVLEFVADEGRCYIPHWMMRNLLLEEGNPVRIQSISLPVANFSKFEPQSSQFLDISNPKAVLENALRNFACLTSGDMVAIRYNDRIYELRVLETKPGPAVSIIECDMDVDFAPPTDYVEPTRRRNPDAMDTTEAEDEAVPDSLKQFLAFGGSGNRLDGKAAESLNQGVSRGPAVRGVPDYDYNVGTLQFFRRRFPPSNGAKNSTDENGFKAFEGKGEMLKPPPPPPPPPPSPPPPAPGQGSAPGFFSLPGHSRDQNQIGNQFLTDFVFPLPTTTFSSHLPRILSNPNNSSSPPLPPRLHNFTSRSPPPSSTASLTPYPGLSLSELEATDIDLDGDLDETTTTGRPTTTTRVQTPALFHNELRMMNNLNSFSDDFYDSLSGPANVSLAFGESLTPEEDEALDVFDYDMEL